MAEVPELEFESGEIELRLQSSIDDKRYEPREHAVFYPALSVPLGAADEFVCPPSHRAAERPQIRRLLVANGSWERATRPQSGFRAHAGGATSSEDAISEGGFTQLVRSDAFRDFISGI
jgi:hypothetical protein